MQLEDIKKQIFKLGRQYLDCHNCSMCNYNCGFIIDLLEDTVAYDNGCYCVKYSGIRPASWDEVWRFYECQQDKDALLRKWELV